MTTASSAALPSALGDLKVALDRHLLACSTRSGEQDQDVQAAYEALRLAAERYDDVLFEVYDEVTPWEFAEAPTGRVLEVATEVDRVAVLVRRDYDLVDVDVLLAAGREAGAELVPDDEPVDSDDTGWALSRLLETYGPDGLRARAEAAGLDPRGGTLWLVNVPDADTDSSLDDDPFLVADEDELLYRVDESPAG